MSRTNTLSDPLDKSPAATRVAGEPQPPRGRPTADRLIVLEDQLLRISKDLFFRHGYAATTMADVARLSRVSKTTLYSRYPKKAALFRAVVTELMENWLHRIDDAKLNECESLDQLLRIYGEMALAAGAANDAIQLNRLLFSESARFPELAEAARGRSARGIEFLSQYFSAFAERDAIPCRDPRGAATLFQNLMLGWFSMALLENRVATPEERNAWLNNAVTSFITGRAAW